MTTCPCCRYCVIHMPLVFLAVHVCTLTGERVSPYQTCPNFQPKDYDYP